MKKVLYASASLLFALFVFDSASAGETFTCKASWYGPQFHGDDMANGEPFDMNDPTTAAHKYLPFETKLRLTNTKNGKTQLAVVRDRGPYIKGRCIDVSKAGAARLGFQRAGVTVLQVQVLD